ncbi:porin [Thiocapsa sp.]|uniref:porin n=1 Tax=Thiocapsa sp. TaxID=2024551 RepID=UPI0025D2D7C8|nr:porin [Thiocapsa sp.]
MKPFTALSALTLLVGGAHAQSSVTLYGVADAAVERIKGATSLTRLASGQQQGSRWGVRGSEDLGGGLRAVFQLEAGINITNGALGQGGLGFGRQSYVGLVGGWGGLRMGRQYSPMDDIAGVIGTKTYDVLSVVPVIGNGDYNRVNNAITYLSPNLGGTSFQVQYSQGENRPSTDASKDFAKQFSMHALHASGPLTAGVGLMRVMDADGTAAGRQPINAVMLVGAYDFGAFRLSAYVNREDKGAKDLTVYGVAGARTFGETTVSLGLAQARDVTGSASAADDDATIVTLQASHNLSKRTAIYSHLTAVSNGDNAALGFNKPALGGSSNGIQVGVRHRF